MAKRAYFVSVVDDGYGIGVIAATARAAKVTGHAWLEDHLTERIDWIDIKVKWHNDILPEALKDVKVGPVDDEILCLRLGIYGSVEEADCPICGRTATVTMSDGKVGCSKCLYDEDD